MVWKTLGRLVAVPFGFLLSALAAGFVLVTLGLEKITHTIHGIGPHEAGVDFAFNFLEGGALLLAGATILPALAVVLIGEVARIRSFVYYVAGGGLALGLIPLLARTSAGVGDAALLAQASPVLATAGFTGGLVYWLIAGRGA